MRYTSAVNPDPSASSLASPASRGATRYQARSVLSEERGVTTYRGVDPVTGLPVLIYRFQGAPRAGVDLLDVRLMPPVLAHRHSGDEGIVITAVSNSNAPTRASEALTWQQLSDAAAALQVAASFGLVHGALTAERFLLARNNLLVEGYGVPWQDPDGEPASLAADMRDWAEAVRTLGHPADERIELLLKRAAALDPAARPVAAELVRELAEIQQRIPAPQASAPANAETEPPEPSATAPAPQVEPPADPATTDDHEFIPRAKFASEQRPVQTQTSEEAGKPPTFVKDLPPRASYRTAEVLPAARVKVTPSAEQSLPHNPGRFRTLLMIALLVLSAVLAGLLLFWRGSVAFRQPQPAVGTPPVAYIIDVQVEPQDLPPVSLYVLEAPPGSAFRPGGEVGTAPRKIALDASGTWVFEGRFQDRWSGPVTVQVPEDRNRTVVIPVPPAGP